MTETHTIPLKIVSYNFIQEKEYYKNILEQYQRGSNLNDVISDSINPM
jgi:hypothetical protein